MQVGRKARVELSISQDSMEVRATAHPAAGAAPALAVSDVTAALADAGVDRGIDAEAIKTLVDSTNSAHKPQTAVVAVGKPAVNATPAQVELTVDREEIDMEAARIDYRAISPFVFVKADQEIGRVKSAVAGSDGFDVYGNELKHQTVKTRGLRLGRNVAQKGRSIVSEIVGRLEVRRNLINVNEVLAVDNVSYESGNIEFHGDVVVRGEVKDRFSIHIDGTLFMESVLDASDVQIGHDLVAKSGIIGRTGELVEVGGEVQAKHIQNVHLKAGAFVIADSIHNSIVEAGMGVVGRKITPGCHIKIGDEEMVVDHMMNQVRIMAAPSGKLTITPVILEDRK